VETHLEEDGLDWHDGLGLRLVLGLELLSLHPKDILDSRITAKSGQI